MRYAIEHLEGGQWVEAAREPTLDDARDWLHELETQEGEYRVVDRQSVIVHHVDFDEPIEPERHDPHWEGNR